MSHGSFTDRTPVKVGCLSTAESNGGEGGGVSGDQADECALMGSKFGLLWAGGEPDLIDMHAVLNKTGLSRSSIYRAIRENGFPPPVPVIGRRQLFVRREVEDWVKTRIAKRKVAASP